MSTYLTVRHGVDVGKKGRTMIEKKVEKLSRFSRHIVAKHVIVEKDGSGLLLELNVTVSRKIFTAKARAFDLVDAIEDAVDKMGRQLRRYEDRTRTKKKDTGTGG
ncbi:MAG: ribosome hibernation-promoting factor, HPF/YfiA family [bacterium]